LIYPDPTPTGKVFWNQMIRFLNRTQFHKFRIYQNGTVPDGNSLFCLQNHIGWWDGFWAWKVNQEVLNRRFFILMLEEQLKTRKLMTKAGAFSIQPGTRDALASLQYCARILDEPGNSLFFYPQGAISSQHETTIEFGSGVRFVLDRVKNPVTPVYLAAFTDYGTSKKPTVSIYLDFTIPLQDVNQQTWQSFYSQAKARHCSLNRKA